MTEDHVNTLRNGGLGVLALLLLSAMLLVLGVVVGHRLDVSRGRALRGPDTILGTGLFHGWSAR